MTGNGKICHLCGFLKDFSEFGMHHRAKDGYVNTCNTCKGRNKTVKRGTNPKLIKPGTSKELLQLNADLIALCEEYKQEVETLKQEVVDLETRLETYQMEDQRQVLGSLRANLELERQTGRES